MFLFNLQVEQLHKIFKLCGSPPEEYWRKSKLPLATMFKPQTNYEASLQERCKGFPVTAVKLLETLLSIDPSKRGTASSAITSEVNSLCILIFFLFQLDFTFMIKNDSSRVNYEDGVPCVFFVVVILKLPFY